MAFASATIRILVVIASVIPTQPVWAITKHFAVLTTRLMYFVTTEDRVFAVFANATLVPIPARLSAVSTASATISRATTTMVSRVLDLTTAPANVANASASQDGQDLIVLAPTQLIRVFHHVEVKSVQAKASVFAVNVNASKKMAAAIPENTVRSARLAQANAQNTFRASSVKYLNQAHCPLKNVPIVHSSQLKLMWPKRKILQTNSVGFTTTTTAE